MLTITLKAHGKTFAMPSVYPSETGSMTDASDNTLILFTCNEDDSGATLERSKAGLHTDCDDQRVIYSLDLQPFATIARNGTFELEVTLTIGPAVVEFVHVNKAH